MAWKTVARPGFSGTNRYKKHSQWDKEYSKGNWRIVWQWKNQIIDQQITYQLYEDGYYADSFNRDAVWQQLINCAKDVYDVEPRDVQSGLDYSIQHGITTHLQDIAIRRVVLRRGWEFLGGKLVQIREHTDYWGNLFSPGKIMFHLPAMIVKPHLEGWWEPNTIEDFYQSNKILQIKK